MYKKYMLRLLLMFSIAIASTLLIVLSANADYNFLYGVQIFNRPIDWTSRQGSKLVQEMVNRAADMGFDIVRGGPEFSNMYDQVKNNNEHDIWGLTTLLPMLKAKNMKLDWVITGVNETIGMTNPPNLTDWKELTAKGASIVSSAKDQPEVIYEIWNEPDLTGDNRFWKGTCKYFYDTFFPAAFKSIRKKDSGAKIINGGLILGNPASGSAAYMTRAVKLLKAGTISMLAIHTHDTLDGFLNKWKAENFPKKGVDVSKIFLNECGLSMEDNNGIVLDNEEIKSFHVAGKVMAAKKLGLGGIVVFHMGGLSKDIMGDLQDKGHYYSYMLDYNNGKLTPNQIYKAVETVIKYTKGLSPVSENGFWSTEKNAGGYAWLFRNGDKVTLAAIGRAPTSKEIKRAFPNGNYKRYDMFGKETQSKKTGAREITYLVSIPVPPEISGTLSNGVIKAKYSKTLTVSGGTASYKWTKSSGTLPTGLKLKSSGTKATISGTPTEAGTFTFKIKVTDANKLTATKSFKIKITKPAISGTLSNGTVKTKYTGTLKVSGGTSSYTWAKSSGTLPNGLKLTSSGAKATISGTPTKAGTFTFKIKVTDKNKVTATKSFTVKIVKASTSSKDTSSNGINSQSEKTSEQTRSEQTRLPDSIQDALPELLDGDNTNVNVHAELKVVSEDIVESFEGKDSDLVKVKAGAPLRFTVGDWGTDVYDVVVYVDDRALDSVKISDEGEFSIPAEVIYGDFKVGVKAKSVSGKRESGELFIISE